MRGADLIREARLRAGLTQDELARRSGVQRSVIARWEQGAVQPGFDNMLEVIARWEQGAVQPGFDNMLEVIAACGFDLPLMLVPRDSTLDERLDRNRALSPERRVQRYLAKIGREP